MASEFDTLFARLPRVEYQSATRSPHELTLLQFAQRLLAEGESHRDSLGIDKRIERVTDFLSVQWSRRRIEEKKHKARVEFNKIRSIIERQVGMLTESRPNINVRSLSGRQSSGEILGKTVEGVWWQRGMQQILTDGIVTAQRHGYAPAYCAYDVSLDYGRGDVLVDFLAPTQVVWDPMVKRAANLQDGDYVILKIPRSIPSFWETYPVRGRFVTPERTLSTYLPSPSSMQSPTFSERLYSVFRKPSRKDSDVMEGALPRAYEYRLYYRDRTVDPQHPYIEDPDHPDGVRPNFLFPRKRLIVWSGDTILYDGHSRYWDGLYPVEVLDWGIEVDHPFGESAVELMRPLQEAMNVLVSGAVDNARLINDPPWIVDEGAMDNSEIQKLRAYGDRSGYVHVIPRGFSVRRDPPGQLTNIVLNVVEYLGKELDVSQGITEVVQGQRPASLQSGIALDSLMLASQIVIRLQARAIEDFLSRLGQLIISRIIQFYSDKRLLFTYRPNDPALHEFIWDRQQFILSLLQDGMTRERIEAELQNLYRDYRFSVVPGSNLAVAKLQKLALYERLNASNKISDLDVLKAAEIPDPEQKLKDARADMLAKAQLHAMAQMIAQGGTPTPPAPPEAPATPAPLQGGIGVEVMQDAGQRGAERPAEIAQ